MLRSCVRPLALAGLTLLFAAGCVGPPNQALLRPAEIPATGGLHGEASLGAGAVSMGSAGFVPVPEVMIGLRRGFGPHVDAGIGLSLDAGLQLDALLDLHHGRRLGVSLDPRLTVGSNLISTYIFRTSGSETAVSASLPVIFGIHLGPDDLVVGPHAAASWYFGSDRLFYLWAGGGVGLDVPVGPVHLLPEIDMSCAVNDLPNTACLGFFLVSVR